MGIAFPERKYPWNFTFDHQKIIDLTLYLPGSVPDPRAGLDLASGGESLIPFWGSGRNAVYWFQQGDISQSVLNTVAAISDIFPVKAAATFVTKRDITAAGN